MPFNSTKQTSPTTSQEVAMQKNPISTPSKSILRPEALVAHIQQL
jgi:hypothetical protein